MVIRPKLGDSCRKEPQPFLVSYKTIIPDSALEQHGERLKSRNKEQQKNDSKAGRKGGGYLFGGKEDTEFMG